MAVQFILFHFANYLPSITMELKVSKVILLHEKFLQFDWLRAVVFQLNLNKQ